MMCVTSGSSGIPLPDSAVMEKGSITQPRLLNRWVSREVIPALQWTPCEKNKIKQNCEALDFCYLRHSAAALYYNSKLKLLRARQMTLINKASSLAIRVPKNCNVYVFSRDGHIQNANHHHHHLLFKYLTR